MIAIRERVSTARCYSADGAREGSPHTGLSAIQEEPCQPPMPTPSRSAGLFTGAIGSDSIAVRSARLEDVFDAWAFAARDAELAEG